LEPATDSKDKQGTIELEVTDIGGMTIQVGANQYQTMDIRIPETSSESLYLDTINVVEYQGPENAMVTLDEAIATLNETRSRIGAFQNRLEYASNSLAETTEDMTSAYSTLLDTDMAEEMTTYTQANVLEQASISVLSQANDIPQTVLSLLQ
jgi:flagellin